MDIFKRILFFLVIALIGVFIFQNQVHLGSQVELVYINYRYTLALGFWLILSFFAGSLLWFALDLKRAYRYQRQLKQKDHQIAELNLQVVDLNGRITRLNGEFHELKTARNIQSEIRDSSEDGPETGKPGGSFGPV